MYGMVETPQKARRCRLYSSHASYPKGQKRLATCSDILS